MIRTIRSSSRPFRVLGYRFVAEVQESQEGTTEEEIVEEEEYTTLKVKFQDEGEAGSLTEKKVAVLPARLSAPGRSKLITRIDCRIRNPPSACDRPDLRRFPARGAEQSVHLQFSLSRISAATPEQDYFADGLTDALIAELARIGNLRVISRTSVMQYRNSRKSLGKIAEELQVDGVIEGSVFRSGQRVRITAALIAAGGERRLWGETYERDQRDMVTLLRVMARTLAQEIPIELTPD